MLSKSEIDFIKMLINDNTEHCIEEFGQTRIVGGSLSRREYAFYLSGTVRGAFDIYCVLNDRKQYSDTELQEIYRLIDSATEEFFNVLGVK